MVERPEREAAHSSVYRAELYAHMPPWSEKRDKYYLLDGVEISGVGLVLCYCHAIGILLYTIVICEEEWRMEGSSCDLFQGASRLFARPEENLSA